MYKIVFICYGNICRSPMAEFLMKKKLADMNIINVLVESRATSSEETGHGVYHKTRQILDRFNIDYSQKRAQQLVRGDGDNFDLLITMDTQNSIDTLRIVGEKHSQKVKRLLDFTPLKRDVLDPWWTRDFDATFNDLEIGLNAVIDYLKSEKII